jgi:hypothetical protein
MDDTTQSIVDLARRVRQLEAIEQPGVGAGSGWSGNVGGTAVTIADGITKIITVMYAVAEVTGAGVIGGVASVAVGGNFVIYWDFVDGLTLAVSVGGVVTLQRTAGADTFDCSLWMVWV